MTETVDAPVPPAPDKASIFEDLIDIFTSPSTVFARRKDAGFFLIMVVVTVLIGGLFLANRGVMQGIMDAEYNRQIAAVMEKNPSLTPEQLAPGKKMAEFFMTAGIFVGLPIAVLLGGLAIFLSSKLFGASVRYGAACMIMSYAYLPKVIESVLVAVQGLLLETATLTGRFQLSLGVGRFLDPAMSPGLLGIVGRIDVFTLWVTVLIGIGISVVGKIPRTQAMLAAAVVWVCGALPAIWQLVMG